MIHDVLRAEGGGIEGRLHGETVRLDPLGEGSVRVRATRNARMPERPSAFLPGIEATAEVEIAGDRATLRHGRMRAEIRVERAAIEPFFVLSFRDAETGEVLTEEARPHFLWPGTRHHLAEAGDLWRIEANFRAFEGERFWGMGQQQHGRLDQKGCVIDLLQKNTEVVVPVLMSSRGYGVVWNDPGTGRVELGMSRTRWVMEASAGLDYAVMAGGDPAGCLRELGRLTGRPPAMPDWALGFWQCKLRYSTQEEVLEVARGFRDRGIPLSCLVIDFFHWTRMGEWRFDPDDFPDPAAMVAELRGMGVRPMVSVWPTVNVNAETYPEMAAAGMVVGSERGAMDGSIFLDRGTQERQPIRFYDATNPEARAFHWERIRAGYVDHGIDAFWLDADEPEMYPMHPSNLRYHAGEGRAVTNAYPFEHQRGYAEAFEAEGLTEGLMLSRSAWVGSQRFPVVVWSGDVASSFAALRRQVTAGLNMAMSGIGWWTTDIGGFKGGDVRDPAFHELLVRWFQWGAFCPVMRLHGFRMDSEGDPRLGRDFLAGGGPNEPWSFGPEVEAVLTSYIALRERLRPYLARIMAEASETGLPPMRPLLVDHPGCAEARSVDDAFMLGPDLLVAPVTEAGATSRGVLLPEGSEWRCAWTGERREGRIEADAPLERIPLFLKDGAELPIAG
jgi:alpha-D-xyloside xylohydrolase